MRKKDYPVKNSLKNVFQYKNYTFPVQKRVETANSPIMKSFSAHGRRGQSSLCGLIPGFYETPGFTLPAGEVITYTNLLYLSSSFCPIRWLSAVSLCEANLIVSRMRKQSSVVDRSVIPTQKQVRDAIAQYIYI